MLQPQVISTEESARTGQQAFSNSSYQWESPRNLIVPNPRKAVVDPVRQANTRGDKHALNHHQLSTLMRVSRLTLPGRDSRGVHAIAPSSHNAAENPLGQLIGRRLQECADGHHNGAVEDRLPASQRVSDEDGEDRAQEASQVVRRDRNALIGSVLISDNPREVLLKRRKIQQAARNALVVSKQPARLISGGEYDVCVSMRTGSPSQR